MDSEPKKPEANGPDAQPAMETIQIGFQCPPGYAPGAFLIVAMDANGAPYTNAPAQPHLALHLARLAMDFASERAVRYMQAQLQKQSPIVTAPAGVIPPWRGPAGRR